MPNLDPGVVHGKYREPSCMRLVKSLAERREQRGQALACVRYLDALILDGHWWLYYEMTRADGAHELRVLRVRAE